MSVAKLTHTELSTAYRLALERWSEAKALYSPDGPELIAAAIDLEETEEALEAFGRPVAA
jgi:hypothetical protein